MGEGEAELHLTIEQLPGVLQLLKSKDKDEIDDGLSLLCQMLSSNADGHDGARIGQTVRQSGALFNLSSMLASKELDRRKQTLYVISNLVSDVVDPNSASSKHLLRQYGTEYRLMPLLEDADDEVRAYVCAALQNLSHDPEWARAVVRHGADEKLERLSKSDSQPLVQRYSSGALKNLRAQIQVMTSLQQGASHTPQPRSRINSSGMGNHSMAKQTQPRLPMDNRAEHGGADMDESQLRATAATQLAAAESFAQKTQARPKQLTAEEIRLNEAAERAMRTHELGGSTPVDDDDVAAKLIAFIDRNQISMEEKPKDNDVQLRLQGYLQKAMVAATGEAPTEDSS